MDVVKPYGIPELFIAFCHPPCLLRSPYGGIRTYQLHLFCNPVLHHFPVHHQHRIRPQVEIPVARGPVAIGLIDKVVELDAVISFVLHKETEIFGCIPYHFLVHRLCFGIHDPAAPVSEHHGHSPALTVIQQNRKMVKPFIGVELAVSKPGCRVLHHPDESRLHSVETGIKLHLVSIAYLHAPLAVIKRIGVPLDPVPYISCTDNLVRVDFHGNAFSRLGKMPDSQLAAEILFRKPCLDAHRLRSPREDVEIIVGEMMVSAVNRQPYCPRITVRRQLHFIPVPGLPDFICNLRIRKIHVFQQVEAADIVICTVLCLEHGIEYHF